MWRHIDGDNQVLGRICTVRVFVITAAILQGKIQFLKNL